MKKFIDLKEGVKFYVVNGDYSGTIFMDKGVKCVRLSDGSEFVITPDRSYAEQESEMPECDLLIQIIKPERWKASKKVNEIPF